MVESPPTNKSVSQNEIKELKRVFDFLSSFAAKNKIRKEIRPLEERRSKIITYKSAESITVVDETGTVLSPEALDFELRKLDEAIEDLQRQIDVIDSKPDSEKRIQARDLRQALNFLGKHSEKKEIEDMIWEVDDNLDGCVDWEEFNIMFRHNLHDTTGLEPVQLFNVVQFLMYDKDFSGQVSVDETMQMLFSRYGAKKLEEKMKSLFGEQAAEEGDKQLTFLDYLKAVGKRQTMKESS